MQHVWSILCRKSIIDPDTNIVNISESLEELELTIPELPETSSHINIPIEFELTSYWVRRGEKVPDGLVKVFDPKNEQLGEFPFNLGFKDDFTRSRTRIKFSGLVLTTEGEYKFKVGYKKEGGKKFEQVAELPLFVKFNFIKTNPITPASK